MVGAGNTSSISEPLAVISLYMAFMISKETENVQSSEEIELAFRAITSQERDYVTQEELHSNLSKEMADYCIARMKPYVDPKTGQGITGRQQNNFIQILTEIFLQVPSTTWSLLQDCFLRISKFNASVLLLSNI